MRKRIPLEHFTGRMGWAVAASLFIHLLLLAVLLIPWPSLDKNEVPPVVTIHLTNYKEISKEKKPIKKPAIKQVIKKQVRSETRPQPEKKTVPQRHNQHREKQIQLEKKRKQLAIEKAEQQRKLLKKKQLEKIASEKARLQALASRKLEQLKAEEARQERSIRAKENKQIAEFVSLLRESISSHWFYPLDVSRQMNAVIKMMLAPTGELLSLAIVKSSNDDAFNDSVLRAVKQAAPFAFFERLDIRVFESHFRTVTLTFTPEGVTE